MIHVFLLSNLLRRPIIVLDAAKSMRDTPKLSGTFVPILGPVLNLGLPLLLAWSDDSHTRLVPIVCIAGWYNFSVCV